MIVYCGACDVAYDDVDYLTFCPHDRVDGRNAAGDPIHWSTILVAGWIACAYLAEKGLPITYRDGTEAVDVAATPPLAER